MRVDIIAVLPELCQGVYRHGVVGRACVRGLLEIHVHDMRRWADGARPQLDDATYGGGAGMVIKPEPVFRAVEAVARPELEPAVVLMEPSGRLLRQPDVERLSRREQVIVLAGRYEGVDERVRQALATQVFSIGDYVLSGGELPALVLVDALARLVPGVVGDPESVEADSFSTGLLDHPHYTRPERYRGMAVPDVLLSGDHAKIRGWRRREALRRTVQERPELLKRASLSVDERLFVRKLRTELESPPADESGLEEETHG